jgi:hypothetical protein
MTIPFFIDSCIIAVSGGIRTTETVFSPEATVDSLWECRGTQIEAVYKKSARINPTWTQQYIPDFSAELQDEKNILKFEIPPVLQLDEFALGFMFIGSIDCLNQYRLFRSRAEYAAFRKHRVQRDSKTPVVIYSDGILEVHNFMGDKIDLRIDGVFQRPTDLPTYNYDLSEIPLDAENIAIVRQMIITTLLGPEAAAQAKLNQSKA